MLTQAKSRPAGSRSAFRRAALLLGVLGPIVATSTARAGNGGYRFIDNAPPIFVYYMTIPAFTEAEIETFGLSSGGDTVLHVQDDRDLKSGRSLAFNDDCPAGGMESCITIPASSAAQPVAIVVRAWLNRVTGVPRSGQARLRVKLNGALHYESPAPFDFSGRFENIGPIAGDDQNGADLGGHIWTNEVQKRTMDAVLLVLSPVFEESQEAIAFDDDDGGGKMAWLHLPQSTDRATIVVGRRSGVEANATGFELFWDDDIHVRNDDGDGLGFQLESALGTSDSGVDADGDGVVDGLDTDGDGINDGIEVTNYDASETSTIKLRTWGALPTKKDVFVEADWERCKELDGSDCLPTVDRYKLSSVNALAFVATLWGPTTGATQPLESDRVALHVDIGVDNPAAAGSPGLNQWGNWGGAQQVPAGTVCKGETRAEGRSMFRLAGLNKGMGSANAGWTCFWTVRDDRTPAHELGHVLALDHGGSPATGFANFKAIYPSIINYAYESHVDTPFYSTASFRGVAFNPAGVVETSTSSAPGWKGTNTTANVAILAPKKEGGLGHPFLVSGNSVDWNKDGLFQKGPVRARVNPGGGSMKFRQMGVALGAGDADLVWYHTPAGNRLYAIYRQNNADGKNAIRSRYSTDLPAACDTRLTAPQAPDRNACGTWSTEKAVTSTKYTTQALGVTEYVNGSGKRKLMLVFADPAGKLFYRTLEVTASGGDPGWTGITALPGTLAVAGGVTVVYDAAAARVNAYATSGGVLRRWSYLTSTSKWDVVGVVQKWSTGADVSGTQVSPAVTYGQFKGDPTKYLFAIMPNTSEKSWFARRNSSDLAPDEWYQLQTMDLDLPSRPALVYQDMPDSSGRFTVLFREVPIGGAWDTPRYWYTEGNNRSTTATVQRLFQWYQGQAGIQEDRAGAFSYAMAFDPTIDKSPRALLHVNGWVMMWPIADGAIDYVGFQDQDDYSMFNKTLGCGIGSICVTCNRIDAAGRCVRWCKDKDGNEDCIAFLP